MLEYIGVYWSEAVEVAHSVPNHEEWWRLGWVAGRQASKQGVERERLVEEVAAGHRVGVARVAVVPAHVSQLRTPGYAVEQDQWSTCQDSGGAQRKAAHRGLGRGDAEQRAG
jgi:hypothetical protein